MGTVDPYSLLLAVGILGVGVIVLVGLFGGRS